MGVNEIVVLSHTIIIHDPDNDDRTRGNDNQPSLNMEGI